MQVVKKNLLVFFKKTKWLLTSSALVLLITLIGYGGFFLRDLFLISQTDPARTDAYFLASVVLMFFITCVAMPIGDAFVLPFLAIRERSAAERSRLLQGVLGLTAVSLACVMCVVLVGAPWIVSALLRSADTQGHMLAVSALRGMAPIILLSAWTVIGGVALNCLGKARESAVAHLMPVVLTLVFLGIASSEKILTFCVIGMVLGTFVNALLHGWALHGEGLSMLPKLESVVLVADILRHYLGMAAISIQAMAVAVLNVAFASSVGEGALSFWVFITKILTLFSALVGTIVVAMILPRLSLLISPKGLMGYDPGGRVRHLVPVGVWLSGALMIISFFVTQHLSINLLDRYLPELDAKEFISVLQMCLLQMPIIAVSGLINRVGVTSGGTSVILKGAALAFGANALFSAVFVPVIGILGVGVGAIIGGLTNFAVLVIALRASLGLTVRGGVLVLLSWLALATICLGIFLGSLAVVGLAFAISVLLVTAQLRSYH